MDRGTPGAGDADGARGRGALAAGRDVLARAYLRYGRRLDPDPVFDAEWDLLIVLHGCRADLWSAVVGPDAGVPVGATRISPAGTSVGWLETVFGDRAGATLSRVGYVTANPDSADHVDGGAFAHYREVWRDAWDDDLGSVPPRAVTDAAIRAGRAHELDRLVLHYVQPQFPSPVDADAVPLESWGDRSPTVWDDLRAGRRSTADVWAAHRETLQAVLADVRLLLENVDAGRAVVTADHGTGFGEAGVYGPAADLALRPLRQVPWAVTTATDGGRYEPPPGLTGTDDADAPTPGPASLGPGSH